MKGMRIQTEAKTSNKNSTIPAVSYSSSDEDEDDFFDAQEDAASKAGSDISSMMTAPVSDPCVRAGPWSLVSLSLLLVLWPLFTPQCPQSIQM